LLGLTVLAEIVVDGLAVEDVDGFFVTIGLAMRVRRKASPSGLVAVDFEDVLVSEADDFLDAPTEGLLLITVAIR